MNGARQERREGCCCAESYCGRCHQDPREQRGGGTYPGVGCSARLLRGDHSVEAIRVFQEGKENRAFQAESTVYANRGGKETACGL